MFSKIEELLAKLSVNKDPQYYNGFRLLTFKEHILCIVGLMVISFSFAVIINILGYLANNYDFSISKVIAIFLSFLLGLISFGLFLVPFTFVKILEKKIVYGSTIYKVCLVVSFIIFITATYGFIF